MILAIKDLTVQYGGAKIVKGVSMHIHQGEIVTLIGNNGAGKTTLLRTISGLKAPAHGEIMFRNEKINTVGPQDIVRKWIVAGAGRKRPFSVHVGLRKFDTG